MTDNQENSLTSSDQQKPDWLKSGVSRRKFLEAGALAASILAAPSTALAAGGDGSGGGSSAGASAGTGTGKSGGLTSTLPSSTASTTSTSSYTPFTQPFAVISGNGEASLQLCADKMLFTYQVGTEQKTAPARTYGDCIPAPTIVVDPGDKIKITLTNMLDPNDLSCQSHELNAPGCFNTTNLHFHGLHVSPSSIKNDKGDIILSSDDVLVELHPGKTHNWCVWLPDFHAPGTHWYHAHLHGATGLQVSNGMAGAILIREPKPEHNMVAPCEDKVWIIQEIIDNQDDLAVYKKGAGTVTGDFLVNGKYQPTIEMNAGQIQRWRFINATATPRGLMTLKLCKADGPKDTDPNTGDTVDIYLVAVDGISFYGKPPEPIGPSNQRNPQRTEWRLAPGNRADFLVKLAAGNYKVIKDLDTKGGVGQGRQKQQVIAYVNVREANFDETIPDKVPGTLDDYPYLKPIEDSEIQQNRTVYFAVAGNGAKGYKISSTEMELAALKTDDKYVYNPKLADIKVDINTAEEWVLSNQTDPSIAKFGSAHPFHIHVNPFQIKGDLIDPTKGDTPDNRRWWDTVPLDPNEPVTILHRFTDYPGEFVLHCHILIHEDQGMMMNVKVDGDGVEPCTRLANSTVSDYGAILDKVQRKIQKKIENYKERLQ